MLHYLNTNISEVNVILLMVDLWLHSRNCSHPVRFKKKILLLSSRFFLWVIFIVGNRSCSQWQKVCFFPIFQSEVQNKFERKKRNEEKNINKLLFPYMQASIHRDIQSKYHRNIIYENIPNFAKKLKKSQFCQKV